MILQHVLVVSRECVGPDDPLHYIILCRSMYLTDQVMCHAAGHKLFLQAFYCVFDWSI